MEGIVVRDAGCDYRTVRVTDTGALYIKGLFQLFELYGIAPDVGLYICDPTDPDKRFIIKRVEGREGWKSE